MVGRGRGGGQRLAVPARRPAAGPPAATAVRATAGAPLPSRSWASRRRPRVFQAVRAVKAWRPRMLSEYCFPERSISASRVSIEPDEDGTAPAASDPGPCLTQPARLAPAPWADDQDVPVSRGDAVVLPFTMARRPEHHRACGPFVPSVIAPAPVDAGDVIALTIGFAAIHAFSLVGRTLIDGFLIAVPVCACRLLLLDLLDQRIAEAGCGGGDPPSRGRRSAGRRRRGGRRRRWPPRGAE